MWLLVGKLKASKVEFMADRLDSCREEDAEAEAFEGEKKEVMDWKNGMVELAQRGVRAFNDLLGDMSTRWKHIDRIRQIELEGWSVTYSPSITQTCTLVEALRSWSWRWL